MTVRGQTVDPSWYLRPTGDCVRCGHGLSLHGGYPRIDHGACLVCLSDDVQVDVLPDVPDDASPAVRR